MEDKLLIYRSKRGSQEALTRIYSKYKRNLLLLAMSLLNDRTASEDVVHDVFVSFVRGLDDLRLTGSLKSYLMTCTANHARNRNKSERRRANGETDAEEAPAGSIEGPLESIVCNEQIEQLGGALAELPFEQRRWKRMEPLDAALWRALMKNKMTKYGTVVVLVIAALVAFQFIGNPFGSKLTFASVIEPILNAKPAASDIVVGPDDGSKPVTHQAVRDSRIRSRVAGTKAVTIVDLEKGRMLVLTEENMEARYVDLNGSTSFQNYMEDMKNIFLRLEDNPDFNVEDLGRKQLDGKEITGFFASHPGLDITTWADVDTGFPVRIECNIGTLQLIPKNMEFDLPMEEEMFSMEVPPGYTVQKPMNIDLQPSEENFIKGLGLIAEKLNYGIFPELSMDDYTFKRPFDGQLNAMPKEEALALIQEASNAHMFLFSFPGEGEWTYRGKGVRLGETGTPIFWYRPQGSETYRVIYGDLHREKT
jgi:RNA polymerase sigma-70 factor (ECF subfamily)